MHDCFPEVITEHGCHKMVSSLKNYDGFVSHVTVHVVRTACVKGLGGYHTQKYHQRLAFLQTMTVQGQHLYTGKNSPI